MGWIKIAVVSAVGVYSFRSVTRVNQLVKQVNVPRHSLLYKYSSKVQVLYLQRKTQIISVLLENLLLLPSPCFSTPEFLVSLICRHGSRAAAMAN